MQNLMKSLWSDEAGAVLSAELVLVMTIVVIGIVVGLAEVQSSLVNELNDIGEAIGSLNQSFATTGFTSLHNDGSVKAISFGSAFVDHLDDCDGNECGALGCDAAVPELPH